MPELSEVADLPEGPRLCIKTCHIVPLPAGCRVYYLAFAAAEHQVATLWQLHGCCTVSLQEICCLVQLQPPCRLLSASHCQAVSISATQVVKKELIYDGATLTLKPKIAYMQDKVAQRHDKPNSPFQAEGTEQASCWNALL